MTKLEQKNKIGLLSPMQKKCYKHIIAFSKKSLTFPLPIELAILMETSLASIHALLDVLVGKGLIKKISRYHYRIAPAQ